MIAFVKNYTLFAIKKKLILLYFLNLFDIMFTLLLLSTGLFIEINQFLVDQLDHPGRVVLIKVILPALILLYIYIRIQKATQRQLFQSNIVINLVTCFYLLINISHLIWIILLPYFTHLSLLTVSFSSSIS